MPGSFHDFFCQSTDGLKLRGRAIGPQGSSHLPVLCLPGLTRTSEDFDVVARALAGDDQSPRHVVSMDYRGRGQSDYDPDPAKYNVAVESGDVLAVAVAAGVSRAILLGTSRGGIISMVLAAAQPALLAGVILNDVGPALEMGGLVKIKGYIENPPPMKTWDEAARGLKALFGNVFPALTETEWMDWARRAFKPQGDVLVRTYDPKLGHVFDAVDPENPPQPIWALFDKMAGVPLMLIHGARSDLLTAQGVQDMKARRPDLEIVEVADQGHAPLLADEPTISRIAAFCARCDQHTHP
ncbi:MAG: alpha/beta hydrolase [Xanthobacteraceae bacterium]|nr:alpha/beta hydrolase [Xanthobacteraceae bacterium]